MRKIINTSYISLPWNVNQEGKVELVFLRKHLVEVMMLFIGTPNLNFESIIQVVFDSLRHDKKKQMMLHRIKTL